MASCSLKEVTDLTAGLLGGQVRLFTTQCVMNEIKALGKEYKGVLGQCTNSSRQMRKSWLI